MPKETRRTFLKKSVGAVTLNALAASAPNLGSAQRQPNVLFIFVDQMRAQAMGCMGNPDVKTPNLDRLAREGVLLRYTFANTPVCCPARACILTGQYTSTHGLVANDLRLRESKNTMAKCFKKAGYQTGFIGKWHLDGGKRMPGYVPPGPRRQGFDFWAANQCSHAHFNTQYFRDSPEPIKVKGFEMKAWIDIAIEFINANRESPFFLTIAPSPPHNPYKASPQFEQMYDADKITMRPNWQENSPNGSRQNIASYYAMITEIDTEIGRLLDSLDDLGLTDDTILFFTSDHGDMLGSHGMQMKRKPHEESIRVPGIMRYPKKIKADQVNDVFFSHVDFAPTLLSMCDIDVPSEMQGVDISQNLFGQSDAKPDSAFFQILGPYHNITTKKGWRGVRTDRYMYARTEDEPWVLFDLENDPYELNNLIDDPAARPLRIEMEHKLADWMHKTGDDWSITWTFPVEDKGRLYKYKTFYTVEEYMEWRESDEGVKD
jgi:arylsulfatase A-like enzyme